MHAGKYNKKDIRLPPDERLFKVTSPGNFCKYRIGETPDGRLCVVTVEDQVMRLWVRGESDEDDGWVLEREMNLRDTVPGLPRDMVSRVQSIWVTLPLCFGCESKMKLGKPKSRSL